jgi:hypothetical protein
MSFLPGLDRYDQYCTRFGCFGGYYKDALENPPPSLCLTGMGYPDPRVPASVVNALCGPLGCAGPLPVYPPASALKGCAGALPIYHPLVDAREGCAFHG